MAYFVHKFRIICLEGLIKITETPSHHKSNRWYCQIEFRIVTTGDSFLCLSQLISIVSNNFDG
jgi:hypothetical protein